jgi:hypothetical protein
LGATWGATGRGRRRFVPCFPGRSVTRPAASGAEGYRFDPCREYSGRLTPLRGVASLASKVRRHDRAAPRLLSRAGSEGGFPPSTDRSQVVVRRGVALRFPGSRGRRTWHHAKW